MDYLNAMEISLQKIGEIAEHAAALFFDNTRLTVEFLNRSENYIYTVKCAQTGHKSVLRVCRPNYQTKSQIESEVAWIKAVEKQTPIIVSSPIQGKNGEYVQSVKLKNDPHKYYCTMFRFLEGHTLDENDEDELIKYFESIGEITSHLHNHSKNWQYASILDRSPWNYETILGNQPKWGRWQDGVAITPTRKKLFQEVSDTIKYRLDKFGKGENRFGLIHGDLRLSNLIIEGNHTKVIDFDDCGFGWFLFDIGASLSFIEHKRYVPELVKAWLKGYRKVRTISKEEEDEIPTFIMMRRLMLIAWIGSRDNQTTREMGRKYTEDTDHLAKKYLNEFA